MPESVDTSVGLPSGRVELPVELTVPADPAALIAFCSPWGQGFESETDAAIAAALQERGFATLRLNALTELERELPENEVDWQLIASRFLGVTRRIRARPDVRGLGVVTVGSSTGAAPALRAAPRMDGLDGIVTRSGRLDYAPRALDDVSGPVLQIVGSEDEPVTSINRRVGDRLGDRSELWVLEGVDHSFRDEELVATVADRISSWVESL